MPSVVRLVDLHRDADAGQFALALTWEQIRAVISESASGERVQDRLLNSGIDVEACHSVLESVCSATVVSFTAPRVDGTVASTGVASFTHRRLDRRAWTSPRKGPWPPAGSRGRDRGTIGQAHPRAGHAMTPGATSGPVAALRKTGHDHPGAHQHPVRRPVGCPVWCRDPLPVGCCHGSGATCAPPTRMRCASEISCLPYATAWVGYLGGETASRIAVDTLIDIPPVGVRIPADIATSFEVAQRIIEANAQDRPDLVGMGSTGTTRRCLRFRRQPHGGRHQRGGYQGLRCRFGRLPAGDRRSHHGARNS